MKIQCDVCDKDEASVFCAADEAALCATCDHRVHHANKLAGKHQRFSLHHPKQAPICDICQERRAFLFCRQDRAILCKECDVSTHKANEHTKKHIRFLLTGVKLSASSSLYSASSCSPESASSALAHNVSDDVKNTKSNYQRYKPVSVPLVKGTTLTSKSTTGQSTIVAAPGSCDESHAQLLINGGPLTSSCISECLIETLPGWQVEDFLASSSLSYDVSKNGENDVLSFLDPAFGGNASAFPAEKIGSWVPQMPHTFHQTQNQSIDIAFGAANGNGFKEQCEDFTINNIKSSRKWGEDNSFAVPQMRTPDSCASKRYKTFW